MATTEPPASVLDASALLALILDERGWREVKSAVESGAIIGAPNYAEVLTKLVEGGESAAACEAIVRGVVGEEIRVIPMLEVDAVGAAGLRRASRGLGLSLGDRSCLALAARLGSSVLTADRAWAEVPGLDVPIMLIR